MTRFFHNFGVYGKTHVTFRHLLGHTSGLPAWRPYYKDILQHRARGRAVNFLGSRRRQGMGLRDRSSASARSRRQARARSTAISASCCSARLIEEVSGMTLDRFCQERIFRPLGLRATSFIDLSHGAHAPHPADRRHDRADRALPVAQARALRRGARRQRLRDGRRRRARRPVRVGARRRHARSAVLRECYARAETTSSRGGRARVLDARRHHRHGSTWALGWDTPSPRDSTAGSEFSPPRRRSPRLHRHLHVDRPRARPARHPALATACIRAATTTRSASSGR